MLSRAGHSAILPGYNYSSIVVQPRESFNKGTLSTILFYNTYEIYVDKKEICIYPINTHTHTRNTN